MKKFSLLFMVLCTVTFTISSCGNYQSIRSAKNVRQLSGNPFMQKVARSVIQNISDEIISKGLTSFKGKPLLQSSLGSMLNTGESVATFKNMISQQYRIQSTVVNNNYSKWKTVRDVIGFVAKNGKRFNFNSYSNKLF
jgi:hypothetical protein